MDEFDEIQENPSFIPVEDPRPWAKETNNISTNLHTETMREVIESAKKADLDPYLMAAIAWKETLGGTKAPTKRAGAAMRAWRNPLQANSQFDEVTNQTEWDRAEMTGDNRAIRARAKKEITDVNYLADFARSSEDQEKLLHDDERFQNARERAGENVLRRKQNIGNAMAKMQDNQARYADEDTQIARYNGVGNRAVRYAQEVKILRAYMRTHPGIKNLVEGR